MRETENMFTTLAKAKKYYTRLIKTILQYFQPIINEKLRQGFELKKDPFKRD